MFYILSMYNSFGLSDANALNVRSDSFSSGEHACRGLGNMHAGVAIHILLLAASFTRHGSPSFGFSGFGQQTKHNQDQPGFQNGKNRHQGLFHVR